MAMVGVFVATYRQAMAQVSEVRRPGRKVGSRLVLFCIHPVNRVNSRND